MSETERLGIIWIDPNDQPNHGSLSSPITLTQRTGKCGAHAHSWDPLRQVTSMREQSYTKKHLLLQFTQEHV